MISRETLELEPIREEAAEPWESPAPQGKEPAVGVIGTAPGVGTTTVCHLLEREKIIKKIPCRVVDLGEESPDRYPPKTMQRLLVVADGRKPLPEGLEDRLRSLAEAGSAVGLVMNRWQPSPSPSATPPPEGEARMALQVPNVPEGGASPASQVPNVPGEESSASQVPNVSGEARMALQVPNVPGEARMALQVPNVPGEASSASQIPNVTGETGSFPENLKEALAPPLGELAQPQAVTERVAHPTFFIPELDENAFTALYNFAFYS